MALSKEKEKIAVELTNYRRRKVTWCKLGKIYGMAEQELKRLLCIHQGEKNNESKE